MMTQRHSFNFLKIFSNDFIRNIKTSFIIILLLSELFIGNEFYSVAAMSSRSLSSNPTTKADKFTAFMERQPESTIAPLYDEVLFECGLNLDPDKIEWRFRSHKQRNNNNKTFNDYVYLNKTVCITNNTLHIQLRPRISVRNNYFYFCLFDRMDII